MNDDHAGYFTQPPTNHRITKLWAYTAIDPKDGNEGVLAIHHPDGVVMPMIASDAVRCETFREYAQGVARQLGREVTLVEFSVRTVVETIKPESQRERQ